MSGLKRKLLLYCIVFVLKSPALITFQSSMSLLVMFMTCFLPFFQFALRLLAFRQIYKVLGMDPLPQMNARFNVRNNRKRRRDNSDGTDGFEAEGKKDKKDHEGF